MSQYSLLKLAADQLDNLANELEASQKRVAPVGAQAKPGLANKAISDDQKTKHLALAKTAADKLMAVGLVSSPEKRDQLAAKLASHEDALQQIAKMADFVTVPKLGTVVVGEGLNKEASSDEVWATHVHATLSRLNLK